MSLFIMFYLLSLRATNKLPKLEKPENENLPRIIFPFYPRMKQEIETFEEFAEDSEKNETFVTLSVNCLEERTYCARFHLQPGKVSVSLQDHDHPVKINRQITQENLQQVSRIVAGHGYLTLNTMEEIEAISAEKPLFMLVSRANAGDLEEKKPVFEKLAIENIDSGCIFAFVTSPYLYEKYAHYPYISFVFVNQNKKFTSYRGDFSFDSLKLFVKHHAQPFMGSPVATDVAKIVAIGNDDYYKEISNKLREVDFYIPTAYINSSKVMKTIPFLCEGKYQCLALIKPKELKLVLINETDIPSSDIKLSQFDAMWKGVSFLQSIKVRAAICFLFYNIPFYIICGLMSVTSLFFFVWLIDGSRVIEFI